MSPAALLLPHSAAAVAAAPQGATNFALFSSNAWEVWLCLFTEADLREGRVSHEILLDPQENRTGDVWHIGLPSLDPSLLYAYRLDGPSQAQQEQALGQAFDAVSATAADQRSTSCAQPDSSSPQWWCHQPTAL